MARPAQHPLAHTANPTPIRDGDNFGYAQVLSFCQQTVEMEQSRRLQNDGGTANACGAHEKSAQAGDTIRGTQVRRTHTTTIEDQQLMPDQHGFGDHGTETARLCQSGQSDDHT